MAHYAFLDDYNVVTEVITGINENELIEGLDTETWYGNFRGQRCVRTSYNAATNGFRKQYAGIGSTYDEVAGQFVSPQPFPSWSLDHNNDWQPPTPKPSTQGMWSWNETLSVWEN